ncbi:MAG: hypothetical protein GY940_26255 [bacterium]|nr:hypothetical protein [bacterium]
MQTLVVKTNDLVMAKILGFIDTLSMEGAEIEVLDDQRYAYEKRLIDQSLAEINEGKTFSFDDVEKELLNVD